jgi:transposase, IS5 family
MKIKLFTAFHQKTDKAEWERNSEFALIDTILELHPELIELLKKDIVLGQKASNFGRKDMPTVELVVRAAIYKTIKVLSYRDLEYAQSDSRICAIFLKLEKGRIYSYQMFQTYISKISEESLQNFFIALNKIAISEGLEDMEKFCQDSFVVETDIHYPTNNSLVWDCIKECHRLFGQMSKEIIDFDYQDYLKGAKKNYYKINNTKTGDKRVDLFKKQLILFTKTINNVDNALKKKRIVVSEF